MTIEETHVEYREIGEAESEELLYQIYELLLGETTAHSSTETYAEEL